MDIIKELENPSAEYRGHPFWSWNDKLDPEELRWQIREMKRVGLGGYFMHARGGLMTEYLSDDWFECINACVDEGKKTGMESWSYDENGWPSGFGGGIVSGMGDRYHVRWLLCGPYDTKNKPVGKIIGFYGVSDTKVRYLASKIREAKAAAAKNETVYYISHDSNINYVDIMSPMVIKEFIKCTYDEYANRLGKDFGGAVMHGFFTDEPQFSRNKMPWSYVMPEEFLKTNGYECLDKLPLLFLEREGYEKFRFDYWRVISRLYTESFGKQIYDWCEEHNCKLTGHAMSENNLFSQMSCSGGVMPLYEYMHNPGMDWLGRTIASPLIPKQVGSVAKQLGKKLVLSETYACCGWDVSFEELKWIGEWQYVNGINWMCQHLEGYSIRGLRKRDYPPSMFYQSPWWDDYKSFNDYFARLGKLIADTNEEADVLLLHPMHSAYIAYNGKNTPDLKKFDRELTKALRALAGHHIGYHLGDEKIIAGHGSVEGANFRVGLCTYKTVILPAMRTLDQKTFDLLREFAANGGQMLSFGEKPSMVDGVYSEELCAFMVGAKSINLEDSELLGSALTAYGVKKLTVSDRNGEITCIHHRVNLLPDGKKAYFFQNQDKHHAYDAKIILDSDADVVKLALEDMGVSALETLKMNGKTVIFLRFAPMQSHLILAGDDLPAVTVVEKPAFKLPLANQWNIESCDDNAMTLDTCRYILGEGDTFSDPCEVRIAMEQLLSARADDKLKLAFNFYVSPDADLDAMKSLRLVSEFTSAFTITLNGHKLTHDGKSWWKDKSFKAFDVRPYVKKGDNEIIIDGTFYQGEKVYYVLFGKNVMETERNKLNYETEIECLYLVGDFGVFTDKGYTEGERRAMFTEGGFEIRNRPISIVGGNIVPQGYTFFSGRMMLTQKVKIEKAYGERIAIEIPKPYAPLANLYVNGKFVKALLWSDYKADITDFVKSGEEATIGFEVVISNRNLFGPHHHPEGESYYTAPHSFAPQGMFDPFTWRERYCFVKAGLGE